MRKGAATGFEKVSATLEAPVLRQIRERTANVSSFLNDAAKRRLYFDRLRAFDEDLGRRGVAIDEPFYRDLGKWLDDWDARRAAAGRRRARARRAR